MQTQKNYKNVGIQILVPNNSAEPLNATSSIAELSSSCNLEGCSTELEQIAIDRIPVISKSGKPLMPCKPAKARKLETRRTMRRARRYRNTRQRQKRFDNRNRKGFIAPSQKAKVELRLKIIKELCKLYPVTDIAVEDVRFNHYKKKWGKHFSTVEIGKNLLYSELRKIGKLHTFEGHETKKERERLGLKKVTRKDKRSPESHATDAIALASMVYPVDIVSTYPFYIWKRYQNSRRQLHRFEPDKKGIRRRYGGSDSIYPFKKNDVVVFSGELARIGGFMHKRISLHNYNLDNKRFTQNASPGGCHRLFNQRIMFEVEHDNRSVNPVLTIPRGQIRLRLPPTAFAGGFPLTPAPSACPKGADPTL